MNMNLSDFIFKNLGKDLMSNSSLVNFVNERMQELANYLQNDNKEKEDNVNSEKIRKFNKEI